MAHKIPVKTLVDPRDASREELDLILEESLQLYREGRDYASHRLFNEAIAMEAVLTSQYQE